MSKKILILHAPGSNRDGDLARAFELAGGEATIAPLTALQRGDIRWQDFALLALPGGFSYGDALGAGRLWALDLQTWFHDALQSFVESGKPVFGVCNGFQVLVKSGILPGSADQRQATLTFNASGHFECRWVNLAAVKQNPSPWLLDLPPIECPVAHGEGRFLMAEGFSVPQEQIALQYTYPDGSLADGGYPINPNGSFLDIAGVTNPRGNVLGIMPHPEDHVYPHQYRQWTRGQVQGLALKLFQNGLNMA